MMARAGRTPNVETPNVETFTVRVDSVTGHLDSRQLRDLLASVEDYLRCDVIDADDDAAVLACNLLARHFDEPDTTEAEWALVIEAQGLDECAGLEQGDSDETSTLSFAEQREIGEVE